MRIFITDIEVKVTEKVLPYDHSDSFVRQDTFYDCGPAATQIVLNSLGINVVEGDLCSEIGTTENGTDCVQMIQKVLDQRLPAANYTSINMPNDPPTPEEREALWANIVQSIDAGYGVIMNWDAPSNNYPVGVKGSVSPNCHGDPVLHYVACMGYDSNPALRAVWIADSGFDPHGYWISFDQAATLIPRKAYAYAAVVTAPTPVTTPAVIRPAEMIPAAPVKPAAVGVVDARDIQNTEAGVDANGWPCAWRFAYSRHPRDFNQIVNDPRRGPRLRTQPDGTKHDGHTDAYEQIVPINEQIAWTHVFSDGIKRDSGDVLLELMELAIEWRKANNLPTSAFTTANPPHDAFTATIQPAAEPATKRATARTAKKQAAGASKKQAARS